jgi:hypothetical protein
MSPTVVVAWMVSSVVPVFFSALRIRPIVVPASRAADTPAAAPMAIAPVSVRSVRADGLSDVDVAVGGADLRVAVQAAGRDVAVDGGKTGGGGLFDPDRALRAVEGDLAEWPFGGELGAGCLHLDRRPGGQLDGDLDGPGAAQDPVGSRGRDPQDAVAVGGGDPCGELHVAALGGVRGPDLDGGVGPVGSGDLDAPGGDGQDGGDRGGSDERLHRGLLYWLAED